MSTLAQRLGQFASLESEGIIGTVELEVDEGGSPLEVDNLAETAMMDAAEDEAVVVDAVIENDELVETTEALEAFLDQAVYPAIGDGGWNRKEAGLAQLAVESIFARIGVADFGRDMVGCESYSNHGSNMSNVTSLEGAIMDALRDIWRKIKEVLNKMVAFIRKWYIKLLDGASRLKKRAMALKKQAESKGGSAKEKKLADSPILRQIHITKKAPSTGEISASLALVKQTVTTILTARSAASYSEALDDITTAIEEISSKGPGYTPGMKKIRDAGINETNSKFGGKYAADTSRYSGLESVAKSSQIIGGKMLVGGKRQMDAIVATPNPKFNVYTIMVDDFADKKQDVEAGALDTLSLSQIGTYCDSVVDILTEIVNYKLAWEKYESSTKGFIQKMDKIVDGKSDEDEKEKAGRLRRAAKIGNAIVKAHAEACRNVINIGMHVSRGTLAYCSASLGQYKAA